MNVLPNRMSRELLYIQSLCPRNDPLLLAHPSFLVDNFHSDLGKFEKFRFFQQGERY
jgi:hypothetical protein